MQRKFEQAAELLKEVVNRDPADVAAYELNGAYCRTTTGCWIKRLRMD